MHNHKGTRESFVPLPAGRQVLSVLVVKNDF